MAMTEFFKGIVDSEEGPIVICNLDYRIIYTNPAADSYYERVAPLTGRLLSSLMDEEMMSKVVMSVEWFKEDRKNNRVFALHDKKHNMDMYILAIRKENGELIGFYGRREDRNPDSGKEYDLD
ncbi:MAG: PAS domain-containing protein [Ruminococcus sp.]|nr:PAS domain-containing protein [Ruminococcus sp.]